MRKARAMTYPVPSTRSSEQKVLEEDGYMRELRQAADDTVVVEKGRVGAHEHGPYDAAGDAGDLHGRRRCSYGNELSVRRRCTCSPYGPSSMREVKKVPAQDYEVVVVVEDTKEARPISGTHNEKGWAREKI
ncbi:hypothetical protein MSAN_01873900 [Mycena sanguinolenta]|uniref:Uncharacterized protein n=1 Tax=Mycena sanguinolenta TaxID=230812 RepID=A0A8H6XU26_9AGAR|nr:hypothetical protein MSAN_01873900 [Mycena sanguinolenta]